MLLFSREKNKFYTINVNLKLDRKTTFDVDNNDNIIGIIL